jgi:hypothetical protein
LQDGTRYKRDFEELNMTVVEEEVQYEGGSSKKAHATQ